MSLNNMKKNIQSSPLYKKCMPYCKKNHIKIKIIILVIICGGMIIRGIMQQPQIIENKAKIAELNEELAYEKERQDEVDQMKDSVGSDEYIEKIARDKLGMIKSNEKVFIDVAKSQSND